VNIDADSGAQGASAATKRFCPVTVGWNRDLECVWVSWHRPHSVTRAPDNLSIVGGVVGKIPVGINNHRARKTLRGLNNRQLASINSWTGFTGHTIARRDGIDDLECRHNGHLAGRHLVNHSGKHLGGAESPGSIMNEDNVCRIIQCR
jgi:hypothetical protein